MTRFDSVIEDLQERIRCFEVGRDSPFSIESDQPRNISWVTFDIEFKDYLTDVLATVAYRNTNEFQRNLSNLITLCVDGEILHYIRTGDIKNIAIRIGPENISSGDINQDFDYQPCYLETPNSVK